MDSKLDFKANVDQMISKASRMLGFVKRQARMFSCPEVTKSLFCSLVRSTLEYCSVVWQPKAIKDISRIESVQKKFLLFALRGLYWQHGFQLPPYTVRLDKLNLETLEQRRSVTDIMFIFDILRGNINVPALALLINCRPPARDTRLSRIMQLEVPFATTRYALHETISRCCRLFNTVSLHYDARCSRDTFKARIRAELRMRSS
jgi:hypothetical protein